MDWETELLNSFETILHRDFPNPRRIGCPGRDLLAGWRPALEMLSPPWSSLISGCAPPASMNSRNSARNRTLEMPGSGYAACSLSGPEISGIGKSFDEFRGRKLKPTRLRK
jgi:hypothetical protein